MFDREAQRQRAINQTAAFLKQGIPPPAKAVIPVYTGPKDMEGKPFKIGQKVVRPIKNGNANALRICKVTHVAGNQVYVDGSQRSLGHPERCLILEVPK